MITSKLLREFNELLRQNNEIVVVRYEIDIINTHHSLEVV